MDRIASEETEVFCHEARSQATSEADNSRDDAKVEEFANH